VSTVTSPVTHTAEVAVKSASAKGARCPEVVATGRERSAVTIVMMEAKTRRASRAGERSAISSIRSRSFCRRDSGSIALLRS